VREAVILAGGHGRRLSALVPDVPKPMAPMKGKPFLAFLLEYFAKKRFEHIVLSVGYMADKIKRYFGEKFEGLPISYAFEETPLGTGGAIRFAMTKCMGDIAFIFNGDTFLELDVCAAERMWMERGNPIIVGRRVEDVGRYGSLSVQSGLVVGFNEKGRSGPGFINAGCYLFPRDLLDEFAIGLPFSIETDFLTKSVVKRSFIFFEVGGIFIDIGIPDDYVLAESILARMDDDG
jgi:D-glycero-alpha-D-manno-heptose 1-phosphate guanylyltransferase